MNFAWFFKRNCLLAVASLFFLIAESRHSSAGDKTVGVIVYTNAKQDGSFNQLAAEATSKAVDELDLVVDGWVTTESAETVVVLRRFLQGRVNHVLALGFENTAAIRTVASENPDVKFTIIDGYIDDMPNVRSILFAEEESGFLAGVVAGLKTKSKKVGVIGGRDIPPVHRFMCGFHAGVNFVGKDVSVQNGLVGKNSSAFRNIQGAHVLAAEMYADGTDIIFAPSGLAAEGVAHAAKDASAFVIMVDANQNGFVPGTVLTSALKRIEEATFANWKAAVTGGWKPGVVRMSTGDKGLDWAVDNHNRHLVADIEDQVNLVRDQLEAGLLSVSDADGYQGCMEQPLMQ